MAWEVLSPHKPIIAICLPHTGMLYSEFVQRTWLPLMTQQDWCIKKVFMCKSYGLPLARNILVENALKSGADYILFVDSDMIPETPSDPNMALRILYECNAPVVSALYRVKKKEGYTYAMWLKDPKGRGYVAVEKWTGNYIKVDAVGLGFCLIKTEVFEKMDKPYFHWELQDEISEDFYFCEKVKKLGYTIRVMTDVRFSHIGIFKVTSDGKIITPEV